MTSTLDPRLYGLIYITGAYGVGKTTLATTAENPRKTAILDFDLKFKAEAERLGFWYRSPDVIKDIFQLNLEEMSLWLKTSMVEIPEGMTTVVFDNASQLEALLGYIVGKEPEKYGVNATNARTGSYGGVNPGIGKLWKNIVLFLQKRGVRVVFVVAHIGSPWMDGKPVPNKFRGKGNKILQELSNLSLVLTRDDKPEPAAIVLKEQFPYRVYKDGEWIVKRIFPLRFPRATWKNILAYLDKPADFDNPAVGEKPSKDEMNMYGDLFTKQQIEFMKAVVNGTYVEDGDAPPTVTGPEPNKPDDKPNEVDVVIKVPDNGNKKPYRFPSQASENFYTEVQTATGNYYTSPYHLLKVLGGQWFNFGNKALWDEKLDYATSHARKARESEQPGLAGVETAVEAKAAYSED